MARDDLSVQGLEHDPFVYAERAQDDPGVPAAQKPDAVQHHIALERALRLRGFHDLYDTRGHGEVRIHDLEPRVRGKRIVDITRPVLQRGCNLVEQHLQMQRLFEKIEGPGFYGRNRGLDARMSTHHDDRELGKPVMQIPQELHAVNARKPDVQEHKRGFHGIKLLPEAFRIREYFGRIPLVLQDARDRGTDGFFVVYYADRVHKLR